MDTQKHLERKVVLQVFESVFIDMTYYHWTSYKSIPTMSSYLLENAHMA